MGRRFSFALSDKNITVRKRLFLTATPNQFDIHHQDGVGDFKIYSMDDEAVYGPRAHTLTFGQAAKEKIICPYKIIISLVDRRQVSRVALDKGITLVCSDFFGRKMGRQSNRN